MGKIHFKSGPGNKTVLLPDERWTSYKRAPPGRTQSAPSLGKLHNKLAKAGRNNPCRVSHAIRKTGEEFKGFQSPLEFDVHWEAVLVGEPMHVESLSLVEAKAKCANLQEAGCVGFTMKGKPSSWRRRDVAFMGHWEIEHRADCRTYRISQGALELAPRSSSNPRCRTWVRGEASRSEYLDTIRKGIDNKIQLKSQVKLLQEPLREAELEELRKEGCKRSSMWSLRKEMQKADVKRRLHEAAEQEQLETEIRSLKLRNRPSRAKAGEDTRKANTKRVITVAAAQERPDPFKQQSFCSPGNDRTRLGQSRDEGLTSFDEASSLLNISSIDSLQNSRGSRASCGAERKSAAVYKPQVEGAGDERANGVYQPIDKADLPAGSNVDLAEPCKSSDRQQETISAPQPY